MKFYPSTHLLGSLGKDNEILSLFNFEKRKNEKSEQFNYANFKFLIFTPAKLFKENRKGRR